MLELNKAHLGDWVENSKKVGDGQINCVMTSPPYYALRDYGVDGQLGLEDTPDEFIENLCDGFLEIKRILRDDGSCWVNLGDTYAGSSYYFSETRKKKDFKEFARPKSQMLMPHRFAIGMVERGWILRNTIIWHKTNPMPESAKDRFTNDFEYLFFFVKSPQYYYKKQYEPILQSSLDRAKFGWHGKDGTTDNFKAYNKKKEAPRRNTPKKTEKMGTRWADPKGRNMRTTWTINTEAFKDHHATYPREVCRRPIRSSCPRDGIVLDPFLGSGTTAVVAQELGRRWLGFELNPDYLKMAESRTAQRGLL
jgi:DNA modification methylase